MPDGYRIDIPEDSATVKFPPTEMSMKLIKMEITHAGHLFQPHGF